MKIAEAILFQTIQQHCFMFDYKTFLKTLTTQSGIYKMFNADGEIIYIGKAKNLKNRVGSYFKSSSSSPKQQAMLAKIAAIEITVTETETEALLLECQQIKRHKPRYNICLRDDKSYPYIFLSNHAFPQISLHRGAKRKSGRYFGAYPNSQAAQETLKLLQKLFLLRQCEDTVYQNRSRPCLQHQIGRCTAPCVGLVSKERYALDVENTVLFLEGKSSLLIDQLIEKMTNAANALDFETAATLRDQIARLRVLLEKQNVETDVADMDIIACATEVRTACVQVFFIRAGQALGNQVYFPKMNDEHDAGAILQAFIPQYYLNRPIPAQILISHELPEAELLRKVLTETAKHNVTLSHHVKAERANWLQLAVRNAETALASRLRSEQSVIAGFRALQTLLNAEKLPERIECFDISHTQGDNTVASCVVFNHDGAFKSAYRRFNITGITKGDDYAAMYQVIFRRFQHQENLPDLIFIDGGTGQVAQAKKALAELALNSVMIIGVAKGEQRISGKETLIIDDNAQPIHLAGAANLLIQQIRDEAHRFAITGHRQRRAKASTQSTLETISGLGAKRRQALLTQFGGLQGVKRASVDALCSINGISRTLAQRIYDTFHHADD